MFPTGHEHPLVTRHWELQGQNGKRLRLHLVLRWRALSTCRSWQLMCSIKLLSKCYSCISVCGTSYKIDQYTIYLLPENLFFLVIDASKYSLCICTVSTWINLATLNHPTFRDTQKHQGSRWISLERPSVTGCAGWISPGTLGAAMAIHGTASWWLCFSKGGLMTSLQVWKWPIADGFRE